MASRPEEDLHCPVCHEIFQEPVLLSCSHSLCRACLWTWWTQKYLLCPVCKTRSLQRDPPRNLALRNLCEHFLREKTERPSAGSASVCSLHSEELRLFCLDHLQLVCVVCLHSETHKNHSFSPIDEAAQDYKRILRELLKPLQEKMELFTDIKGNFDQTAKDVEVQAQDTERQIKDAILMLQNFLQKEERERMEALSKEKLQKTKMLKTESDTLSKDTAALSDTIRATEEALRAEDVSFLQTYKTAAQTVQSFLLNDLQPMSEALIDVDKHLNNLPFKILDSMKTEVTNTKDPKMLLQDPLLSLGAGVSMLRAGDRRSYCGTEFTSTSQSREQSLIFKEVWATTAKRNSLALNYDPRYQQSGDLSTERTKPPRPLQQPLPPRIPEIRQPRPPPHTQHPEDRLQPTSARPAPASTGVRKNPFALNSFRNNR